MIRYSISKHDLTTAINEAVPTWLVRASDRTAEYDAAGRYAKPPSSIWSEIKRVFMDLQGYKCGFCERRLERSEFGNVEHDVEHFRPKAMVEAWPPVTAPERGAGLDFDLGQPSPTLGYYLLPHHFENYLISCKTCNTALKSNGFPVEGARDLDMESPRHTNEKPLLVYPIGLFDDDPQDLIRFEGILPVPAANRGRRRRRGRTVIRFFELDERDGLLLERSKTIVALHLALANIDAGGLIGELAQLLVEVSRSHHAAHTNCARSFVDLWISDQPAAHAFSQAALDHLSTVP